MKEFALSVSAATAATDVLAALLPKSPMFSSKRLFAYLLAVLFCLLSYGNFILVTKRDLFCNSNIHILEARTATTKTPKTATSNLRLAVASYVDGNDQIYGIYSIRNQLEKFNMTLNNGISQIVIIPNNVEPSLKTVLVEWLGEDNVRSVDNQYLLNKIKDDRIWKGTFNKMWIFNQTDFDKIIMLDADVLIRTKLMHWFDYPAPCGIQAEDSLAWNSGTMVIEPNSETFHNMLELLPNMTLWNDDAAKSDHDSWSMGYGDQDFLTAYFTNSSAGTLRRRRCVMPTEAAVLSTSFKKGGMGMDYFGRFRRHLYETVHFTSHKPWRRGMQTDHPLVCAMLREWNESMTGIQKYLDPFQNEYIVDPIHNDYLGACPPEP